MEIKHNRIALCLHGLASGVNCKGRKIQFNFGYKYLKSELLEPYADRIDVFVHCWNPEMKSKIDELYHPKKSKYHPAKNRDLVLKGIKNVSKYPMFSNLYSFYEADLLRQEYQKENSFVYDCVIHTRFDIKIKINRSLDTYSTDRLYVISRKNIKIEALNQGLTDLDIFRAKQWFCDYLFMGNDEIMTHLTKIYFSADRILKERGNPNTHRVFGKYLSTSPYPIETIKEEDFYVNIFTRFVLEQESKSS